LTTPSFGHDDGGDGEDDDGDDGHPHDGGDDDDGDDGDGVFPTPTTPPLGLIE
jgi:hypothetical protein